MCTGIIKYDKMTDKKKFLQNCLGAADYYESHANTEDDAF